MLLGGSKIVCQIFFVGGGPKSFFWVLSKFYLFIFFVVRFSENAPNGADRQTEKQTNKQTDGHCDSMTELAQWGQFSENVASHYNFR